MENYELIIRFFQGIGAPKEADGYLRLFHKGDPSRFAVIKVGGKILQQSKDLLAFDLAYLSKLDLFPIVIHGGGPQIDVELAARGIESRKIGGIRVTPREAVEVIRDVLMSANSEVVQAVRDASGTAIGVNSGIFRAERVADPELGYVGEVTGVDLKQIVRAVRADMIPIVNPIGFGPDGQAYNINADTAARALVLALRPKKFILITEEGGVRGADGEILPYINLNQDYDRLVKTGVISGGMLVKVREIKELLERTKGRMVVTIASAENLLKELFTAKGAGTFVKLGSRIREVHSWRGVNVDRTRRLIERSFGKPLTRGYFRRPVKYVFYEENYKGCAVVKDFGEVDYLDKFSVRPEAQGEGIGADLWDVMIRRCGKLFWRSNPRNPINAWYMERCDGMRKFGKWWVFWLDLSENEIRRACRHALALPRTLRDAPPPEPVATGT